MTLKRQDGRTMPQRMVRAAGIVAMIAALALPVSAQGGQKDAGKTSAGKSDAAKPDAGKQDDDKEDKVDSENLFGFTEGTDVGRKGEQEVILDTIVRLSKRRAGPGSSGYAAAQPELSYQLDLTDQFSIEPGIWLDTRRQRNIADLPDTASGGFNGGSLELKYQFHKRTDDSPFGLAIQSEPQWARIDPIEGIGGDVFSADTRLIADARLIPDTLWAAANLIYDPQVANRKGSGEVERSSTLAFSGSLMGRVSEHVFLGPEIRYARAYDGAALNRFDGDAVFLGPVLHMQVEKTFFLTVAAATQVYGHDRDPSYARQAFNLTQFPRHAVRIRFGAEF
ncbi:hypothetical protein [uncultured Methylobacterium sp.]|jgi:hypothetical protein|uniref:hypothetical protein n=1 Tax=uncultured Methylobacterium sp. TaxID=157278 RepID=UPI0026112ECA|nr:hypothetical protein [uncultured Methylobacterium sp.]